MLKFITLFTVVILFSLSGLSQNIHDDYQLVLSLDTQMKRKINANELMIDWQEKYIIVNYGNKPTYIIVYSLSNYKVAANFRLSNWVEFSGAYYDSETNQLYVKESRYSSEYYRLDINTGEKDILQCHLTPGGCPVEEPKKTLKSVYSSIKEYYITINKHNSRDVRVYKHK